MVLNPISEIIVYGLGSFVCLLGFLFLLDFLGRQRWLSSAIRRYMEWGADR